MPPNGFGWIQTTGSPTMDFVCGAGGIELLIIIPQRWYELTLYIGISTPRMMFGLGGKECVAAVSSNHWLESVMNSMCRRDYLVLAMSKL
jgi:hypothetical protein